MFFAILSMVTFVARQSEDALFKDGIFFVPKRNGKVQQLVVITYTCNTFLTPPVCFAPCRIMRYIFPCIAVRTIIFPYRSPLPFGKVWTKFSPVLFLIAV